MSLGLSLSSPNLGVIGCLLELHVPQGLLIIRVIVSGGLEIHLSDLDLLLCSGMHLSLTPGLSLSSPNPRAIRCLLKFHLPQGLLIIRVIASGGLEVRLSTQVDPGILEYSGKEVALGEYSCRALNAGDHMHHHKISYVNPFPGEDRVHNKCLKVGDLVSMSSTWQENSADHVVKDSAGHGQAVC